jgi:hypothetical protein
MRLRSKRGDPEPPYLYRLRTQVVQRRVIRRELPWFWAWLIMLPAPDSCRVLRAGGRVKDRAGGPVGVAGAWRRP